MRVGSRWPVGGTPPAALPASLFPLLVESEGSLPAGTQEYWTLTWLEGRPRAALPGVGVVTLSANGQPLLERVSEGQGTDHAVAPQLGSEIPDEDDDDWLL